MVVHVMGWLWPLCGPNVMRGSNGVGVAVGVGGWVPSTYVLYIRTCMCAHVYECTYVHTCVDPYSKGKFTGPEHNNSVHAVSLCPLPLDRSHPVAATPMRFLLQD